MDVTDDSRARRKGSAPTLLEKVWVPILVAALGAFYTLATAFAQIRASEIAAQREIKTELVGMLSLHLADADPAIALSLIDMLDTVDGKYATRLRHRIGQPATGETIPDYAGRISPAVRCAVRTELASEDLRLPRGKGEWYAVLASFNNRADAFSQRTAASQRLGQAARSSPGREWSHLAVQVYLASNGNYAVTLGGPVKSRATACELAAFARIQEHDFRFAYAWQTAPGWTHIPAGSTE